MTEEKQTENKVWEPKIVVFVCTWCTYAGSDLAGTSRMQYPTPIRIIRTTCSGNIDPMYITKAFERGADGILVSGCHPGDCHYTSGNFHARRRFAIYRTLLDFIGIDIRRLKFSWISAAEAKKFTEVVTSFTKEITELGPNKNFKSLLSDFEIVVG